jgi:prepilin-type N-terminal cleavage/methylation domain-containing protein
MKHNTKHLGQSGFSLIEIVVACVILPILVVTLSIAYNGVKRSYGISRQLGEIYAVLSACPEIDRALEYDSVTSSTNCYPNNSFLAEGGSSTIITYNPTLSITNTSALPASDPLQSIPDSKVIDVKVGYQKTTTQPLELRMLITRNGIGQQ